ncbi:MAG TPA: ROK family protein [Membranihabitans sp.]|nr:ROK family protein [Membranihabitans sp.]
MKELILDNEHKVRLVKCLYGRKELAVSDLSAGIQKSVPFTSALINEMVEDGVLIETGLAKSRGGRRAQLYSFKPGVGYIVGVAVNQVYTTISIVDLNGTPFFEKRSRNIPLRDGGGNREVLGSFINRYIEESGVDRSHILGVGIGMPGFVNVRKGVNHTFFKDHGTSLISALETHLKLPVFIDNDSSLIALAELKHGLARNRNNTLVVNIGWGIGLGIIIAHRVFRGENGYAGEFSHIPIFENDKICSCGKIGCLETETSLNVLLEKARTDHRGDHRTILPQELPEDRTEALKLIFNAIEQGDSFAIGLLKYLGQNLGRGLSILIHLFNPGLIVLSGMGSIPGKYWWPPVQQAINEHSIGKLAENIELKMSKIGPDAELIGATDLVVESLESLQYKLVNASKN